MGIKKGAMNLSDLLRATSERVPDKQALVYGQTAPDHSLTWGEIDGEADAVAAGLKRLGVEPGDRVAIAMHNVPHFIFALYGIVRAGAVAVPLNVMLTEAEAVTILRDAEPRVVLGAGPFGATVAAAAQKVSSVEKVITTDDWSELGPADGRVEAIGGDDDLAVLAYTSGTTGQPKGAMLSHANLLANLDQQMSIPEDTVHEDDVILLSLPFFHIFGLNVPLGLMVKNCASGILLERFEPVPTLRLIDQGKITVLCGAPPMYVAWTTTPGADQYDLSSIRLAISGAAPLSNEVLQAFQGLFGFDIDEGYGLTETSPTLTSNRMAPQPRVGSVGKPLPGVELRIVDEAGNDVELGDPGEVIVKGPNVFKGYWRNEEATNQVFVDGWFRTGDIAVRDEDGFIYLVDRKRDLVIVSGFNVFPSEVEEALLQNPRVKEAAVLGVPHQYRGETIKAYVVLTPGETVTEDDLLTDVRERIARFKSPESIEIVDELPHLLSGKVLRRALRTEAS
jgi:long-chain acyl-CoA synthetase